MAVRNSVEPEATFQLALSTLQSESSFTSSGASVFQVWNRYSCHIATDFVEHQRELDLRASAAEQSATTFSASTPVDTRPLLFRQIDLALKLDEDFAQKFAGSPWSTAYQFVLDRLMNHGHPGVEEFKQALLCMWRIGDREKFLESVLPALDGLLTDADDDVWHLVRLAYQEALILRRQSDSELLFNRICESPEQQEAMEEIASLSKQEAIDRQLTPMGKMALRAANWDLSQAIASKNEWRDAGAMSLGFFRILELEFNERLIFPLVHQVDFAEFESLFETLKSNATSSRTQNAVDFWKKMKSPLLEAKKSRKGLDLGALELFIQKIRSASGGDIQIKELLRRALCSCITPKGVEAFNAGELEALLNGQAREKYRNPAAHARYVDLATARECKTYVEDALDKLLLYTHTFQVEGLLH
jgi:hypothetical protein